MKRLIFFIFIISIVYNFTAMNHGLVNPDEPRYASTSKNMVVSGNYLIPYFNGELRVNKPPMTYWVTAISYKLFGFSDYSSRLPQILSAILIVILSITLSWGMTNNIERIYFAVVLSSSPLFFYLSRYANTDMIMTLFFTLSLLLFYRFYKEGKNIYLLLFFLFFTLASMTKGPVVLLILLIIFIFLIIKGKLSIVLNLKFALISIISTLLPAIYLLIIHFIKGDGAFDILSLITQETTGRFIKGYRHAEPFYFYIKFLPILFFPWIFLLIFKINKLNIVADDFGKFNIIWFLVIIIFFSISNSKLLSYILPLSIPFGYICAKVFTTYTFNIRDRYLLIPTALIILSLFCYIFFARYSFVQFQSLAIYTAILIVAAALFFTANDFILKLGIVNIAIFLSIFTVSADFINQNKSDKFLSKCHNIEDNKSVYTFRNDMPGVAYYLSNYKVADNIDGLEKKSDYYLILFKKDFDNIKSKLSNYKILSETKKKIFIEVY